MGRGTASACRTSACSRKPQVDASACTSCWGASSPWAASADGGSDKSSPTSYRMSLSGAARHSSRKRRPEGQRRRGRHISASAIRGNHRQSEAIRGHQRKSEAIRGNQRQPEAIRGNQRQPHLRARGERSPWRARLIRSAAARRRSPRPRLYSQGVEGAPARRPWAWVSSAAPGAAA